MAGKWKKQPILYELGTLLLDSSTIHFDKQLYNEMEKDNKKDLLQCDEDTWGRKINCELNKCGIIKVGSSLVKYKKWSMVFHLDHSGSGKEKDGMNKGMSKKVGSNAVKKEKVLEEKVCGCGDAGGRAEGVSPL
jgi:hypothetical protein